MAAPHAPYWNCLTDTPAEQELDGIRDGLPWTVTALAGLQYHDYHADDGLDGKVEPRMGDRLHLVREPDNRHDPNAIAVYWRNEHMLGHLPFRVAQELAGPMDRGASLRAYVVNSGTGAAWSCKALLVGEPLRRRMTQWTERAVDEMSERVWPSEDRHAATKEVAAQQFLLRHAQARRRRREDLEAAFPPVAATTHSVAV